MSDYQLPQGWAISTIQNLISHDGLISDGDWVESKDQDPSGSIRLIQLADIGDGVFRNKSHRFMSEEKATLLNCTLLQEGDILVARMPDPLGRACLFPGVGQPAVTVVDVCLIRGGSRPALNNYLLRYWINSPIFRNLMLENASGTTRKRITRKKLEKFELPIPHLAEQKVIADKLDTLLAQVENTKARLERIPQILKRFRQSVLAAAVSGRLTEEWRPNSNSYVHASSSNWSWPPVPETWQVNLYSELVDSRLGKMLDKSKNRGIPTKYLGNINVRWFEFNLTKAQEILATEGERTELAIRPGDVLICEGGEPGRCAIWDDQVKGQIVFQKALHRARVREALIPEWLAFNLRHDADSLTLEQLFTGTTIKHLTGKALKKYPLRIPPIDEQTEIVRQVNQLFAYADRIEQHANNALARVNKQSQSILAKAFQGELTEQWRKDNPDLISGEHSAAALLERIKTKQAAQTPHKQVKKYMKVSKASVTTGSNVFSIDSHS